MLSQQQGGLFCPMCLFKIAFFFPPYMIGLFTCLQHVPWESEKEVPGNLIELSFWGNHPFGHTAAKKSGSTVLQYIPNILFYPLSMYVFKPSFLDSLLVMMFFTHCTNRTPHVSAPLTSGSGF